MTKLISLTEAISKYVNDGDTVYAAGFTHLIPFAAGHEIIRQKKRNLTLARLTPDLVYDQMIGAGCVQRVQAAWVGNVITGSGYNFRRAVESGALRVEDHSNLTIAMALKAAAMGVSFMPVRTALGSDLCVDHPGLKPIACPFTGGPLAAVAAIAPDVTLIHVQRADASGSAHAWGNLGVMRDACLAARHVVITAEQIAELRGVR